MKKKLQKWGDFFRDGTRKMKDEDWVIVLVLVVFYSFLSFYHLGSLKNPQTFYYFDEAKSSATVFVDGSSKNISSLRYFTGEEVGSYILSGSFDGENYQEIKKIDDSYVFMWNNVDMNSSFKYLKIEAVNGGSYIGEIQLYDQYGQKVTARAMDEEGGALLDEADTVPGVVGYMNSTYFDEIYFARSAYEYLHNIQVIEWVHPPLGKLIQMIPIIFLGMNPFAYRLMGNIAGILMIPVLYVFAKTMFKSRKYALFAGLLMMFDNFHFAQTRMGTVDSFLVLFMMLSALFMYKYLLLDREDTLRPKLKNLAFSGLFFGMATTVKWTGLYLGLGLAIVFFGKFFIDFRQEKKISEQYQKIIAGCFLFFIFVPLCIYVGSYFLFPNVYPRQVNSFSALIAQIQGMFQYHSRLQDTHPFSSPWYTWPIMKKPVWYFVSYPQTGLKSTIVGIGNPAIWWVGIGTFFYSLYESIKTKKLENIFLCVMCLSLWLPYVFIGRVMFLYHYFPVLPFLMLGIVAFFKKISEYFKTRWIDFIYLGIVIMVFVWFYPVVSGMTMPESYIDSLKWLSSWIF